LTGPLPFKHLWRAAADTDLVWVCWQDGAVVLHRPSGKTHFLNPSSVWLLRRLQTSALPVRDAAIELAAHEAVAFDETYRAKVEEAMFRLGQLGLLHCRRS